MRGLELFPAILVIGIGNAAIDRADFSALGLVEASDALRTFVEVDDVDRVSGRDRLVRAFGLAGSAIDAFFGDLVSLE